MHAIFRNIRAALFDLDGTLVETDIDFSRLREATLQLIAEYGVDASAWSELDVLAMIEKACERLSSEEQAKELRTRALARLQAMEMAYCATPRPVSGAYELLERLRRQGVYLGIITRNDREVSLRTLHHLNLPYDLLLSRSDVQRVKPHPEHVLAALRTWQIPPDRGVVVGDYWMDIQAGREAGCRTVGIWRKEVAINPFRNHPPDLLVRHLQELLHEQ